MITIQQAMTIARGVINDTVSNNYRYTDPDLTQYGNDALDAIAEVKPDLFYETVEITCIANTTIQKISQANSLGLVDIFHVKNGNAVTMTTRDDLDRSDSNWHNAAAAPATNWAPMANDPFRYFIYPKAPVNQVLIGMHIKPPLEYLATDTLPLSDKYLPVIANYIVAVAESRNDEAVSTGRAASFLGLFYRQLGVQPPQQGQ